MSIGGDFAYIILIGIVFYTIIPFFIGFIFTFLLVRKFIFYKKTRIAFIYALLIAIGGGFVCAQIMDYLGKIRYINF